MTIMGGALLRRVASVAKLRKKVLKPPDRTPRNHDQRPFKLHGKMDLTISFAGRKLTTPVYIKMDTEEPLLLSEGVCRQLGIICYLWMSKGRQRVLSAEEKDESAADESKRGSTVETAVPKTGWFNLYACPLATVQWCR